MRGEMGQKDEQQKKNQSKKKNANNNGVSEKWTEEHDSIQIKGRNKRKDKEGKYER